MDTNKGEPSKQPTATSTQDSENLEKIILHLEDQIRSLKNKNKEQLLLTIFFISDDLEQEVEDFLKRLKIRINHVNRKSQLIKCLMDEWNMIIKELACLQQRALLMQTYNQLWMHKAIVFLRQCSTQLKECWLKKKLLQLLKKLLQSSISRLNKF